METMGLFHCVFLLVFTLQLPLHDVSFMVLWSSPPLFFPFPFPSLFFSFPCVLLLLL
ncbi:hypothetical protein DFH27DRAFT_539393 [Peziza echinospora]|nr:hypothetical protein DFH27DRAFT_539393 [Peziza echinospora]